MPIELPLDDAEASTDLPLTQQLVRFVVTGAGSGAVDFGVTVLLQYLVGAPHWLAKAAGFVCGTTMAYLINRRWTFRTEPSRARFIAVVALYLVTFAVQVGLYTALSAVWPEEFFYSLAAFVIAQGTATVINFVVQRVVIFKIR
ncbi:GtrA family protein [Williamsia sp. CHRR-6]|uniref:GtrA family protein n=1 Tax=Williamsia sp. CHRR-6 TaxID=2835871 RepID=UPI001BDB1FDC|nr:GtrA family protein [Williamsia sp. CHRR-6]